MDTSSAGVGMLLLHLFFVMLWPMELFSCFHFTLPVAIIEIKSIFTYRSCIPQLCVSHLLVPLAFLWVL